jgi:hypothetical protein
MVAQAAETVAHILMASTEQPDFPARRSSSRTAAILTDSHFLIPLIVFCVGLTLLITLR